MRNHSRRSRLGTTVSCPRNILTRARLFKTESIETALLVSKGRNIIGHNKLYSELLFRVKVTDEVRPVGLCLLVRRWTK